MFDFFKSKPKDLYTGTPDELQDALVSISNYINHTYETEWSHALIAAEVPDAAHNAVLLSTQGSMIAGYLNGMVINNEDSIGIHQDMAAALEEIVVNVINKHTNPEVYH